MVFNESILDNVLKIIEEKIHFCGDNLSEPQDWNLILDLPVQEILDKNPEESEKVRYVIKILDTMGYINFKINNHSVIDNITQSGLKYLLFRLHHINFNY